MHARVSITRGFCPLCYRGLGCECERVAPDSARIDPDQRECSLKYNGLPLLDLREEGGRCKKRCRIVCLVCGRLLALACEPEFDEALEAVEQYEERLEEARAEAVEGMRGLASIGERMLADIERRLLRRLGELGMGWHPRWRKLTHAGCLKKAACHCVLPVGVEMCRVHKKKVALVPRRPAVVVATLVMPPAPPAPRTAPTVLSKSRPAVMIKATWLQAPTSTTLVPAVGARTDNATIAPRPRPKPPAKSKPPNPRLQEAASKCRKLDTWAGRGASGGPSPRGEPGSSTASGRSTRFDRSQHERDFDPYLHGRFNRNGVRMYRFPDGTVQEVFSEVNEITEDGQIVPR